MNILETRIYWLERALDKNAELMRAMYSFINTELHPGFSAEINKGIEEMDDYTSNSAELRYCHELDKDYYEKKGL